MESHPMHEIPYTNGIFQERNSESRDSRPDSTATDDDENYLTMFKIPRASTGSSVTHDSTSLASQVDSDPRGSPDRDNGRYRKLSVGSATSSLYRHQILKSTERRRWLLGCLAVALTICAILAIVVIVMIVLYSKKGPDHEDIPVAESLRFNKMHVSNCQILPGYASVTSAIPYMSGEKVPAREIQSCFQENPNPKYEVHCLAQDFSNSTVTVKLEQKGPLTGELILVLLSNEKTSWKIINGENFPRTVSVAYCERDTVLFNHNVIKQKTKFYCPEGEDLSDHVADNVMKDVQLRYGDITSFTYTRLSNTWDLLLGKKVEGNRAPKTTTTTLNPSETEDILRSKDLVKVRLADGNRPSRGHVQLLLNDHWHYLCEDLFDFADAQVVCRTLGFGDRATLQYGTYSNTVASKPLNIDIGCNGHELNLTECGLQLVTSRDSCSSKEVAALTCIPESTTPSPTTGHESLLTDVRLVSGSVEHEGNVQVRYGSTWRYLCNSYWSVEDANVVCNYLGFGNAANIYHFSYFGTTPANNPPVIMLHCLGTESTVTECSYGAEWNYLNGRCAPEAAAGVTCQGGPIANFSCNFEFGFCGMIFDSSGYFGWGRINGSTSTLFTGPDTDHTTGSSRGFYTFYESSFGQVMPRLSTPRFLVNGTSAVVYNVTFWYHMYGSTMGKLRVYKNDSSSSSVVWQEQGDHGNLWHYTEFHIMADDNFTIVFEAERGNGVHSDIALDDIIIKEANENAYIHTPSEDIWVRLVGGRSIYEGLVEVQYLGEWGTVCGVGWDFEDAAVVCRMLGSSVAVRSYAYTNYHYGAANGTVWLRRMECTGNETSLSQCQHPGWEDSQKYGCLHNMDAAVKCKDPRNNGAECTFEGGLCEFTQDKNDDMDWALHQGGSTAVQTDPVIDHTLGTVDGYYIYLESANAIPGNKGRISTTPIQTNGTKLYTISFWFFINNGQTARQASLSVFLVSDGGERKLWELSTRRGGTGWRYHFLNVTMSSDFKVVFEGSIQSSNYTGTVRPGLALDDVFITHMENSVDVILKAESIRLSGGLDPWEGRVELYYGGVWGTICDDGWDITDAGVACRMLGFTGAEFAYSGAFFGAGFGRVWLDNVDCLGHEISLEHCSHSGWGRIPQCGHHEDAGVRCVVPETFRQGVSSVNCTFEDDLCGFVDFTPNYAPYIYNWARYKGGTPTGYTGPSYDHTLGNRNGHYIFTEGSNVLTGLKAKIASPTINPEHHRTYNVSFWIYMFGLHMGTLNVYVRLIDSDVRKGDMLLWKHSGNTGPKWLMGHFFLHTTSNFKVIFESTRGSGYLSDIALDDVLIRPQEEKEFSRISCTFEGGLCDFVQDTDAKQMFSFNKGRTNTQGTGPEFDHTLGTDQGVYLYLEASNNDYNDTARLISPILRGNTTYAVRFWYHMLGEQIGSLSVYLEVNGTRQGKAWTVDGNHGNVWLHGTAIVNGTKNGYVVFEGRLGTGHASDIALDDISIEPVIEGSTETVFTTPAPPSVPVRLVQGAFPWEGRVEVYHLDRWGTVCHDEWDIQDARVVCRMLGFSDATEAFSGARFGAGSGVTWLDNVRCQGDEASLLDCPHNGWAMEDCSHLQDAGVRCTGSAEHTTPSSETTTLFPPGWCLLNGTLDGVNPYLPHVGNCSMFLICLSNGIVATTYCPAGEFFSPDASMCVPAANMSRQCSSDGTPIQVARDCEAGWSEYQAHCYKYFSDIEGQYVDAENICAIHGSKLVSILSQDEQDFVGALLSNTSTANPYVYVGFDTIQTLGQWRWNDGSTVSYENWDVLDFQPDPNATGERCAAMTTGQSKTWYDRSCLEEMTFICKKKK